MTFSLPISFPKIFTLMLHFHVVFLQAGCQILRFRDAVQESTQEAQALAKGGSCPPHMRRDPPNSGLFRNSRKNGGGDSSGDDGERIQATCSDTRAVRCSKLKHGIPASCKVYNTFVIPRFSTRFCTTTLYHVLLFSSLIAHKNVIS